MSFKRLPNLISQVNHKKQFFGTFSFFFFLFYFFIWYIFYIPFSSFIPIREELSGFFFFLCLFFFFFFQAILSYPELIRFFFFQWKFDNLARSHIKEGILQSQCWSQVLRMASSAHFPLLVPVRFVELGSRFEAGISAGMKQMKGTLGV